jgi:hypothetical protein
MLRSKRPSVLVACFDRIDGLLSSAVFFCFPTLLVNHLVRSLLRGDGELARFARVVVHVGSNFEPKLLLRRRCNLEIHRAKCSFDFFDPTASPYPLYFY